MKCKEGRWLQMLIPIQQLQKQDFKFKMSLFQLMVQKLRNSDDLRKYLYTELEVGDKAQLEVYRGNEKVSVQLELMSNSGQAASKIN